MGASVQRPQRLSLTQQCVESMKQHIVRGALQPGDRLPTEHEWVEQLGVSRLVVREALQTLAGIGLIDVRQGRGAFLRDGAQVSIFEQLTFGLDLRQLSYSDVFEARAMLDLAVLELCMLRADTTLLDELEALIEQMRLADSDQSVEELHRAFHRRLLHAAGNPLIERVGLALLDTFWRIGDSLPELIYPATHQHGYNLIESHRMLLDAIRARDLAHSRELIAKHLPVQPEVGYVFPTIMNAQARNQHDHE